MIFWVIALLITLVVGLSMTVGLLRGTRGDDGQGSADLPVYRDQLDEVERDLARGILSADEAERVRIEISRRILAADKARPAEAGADAPRRSSQLLAGVVLLGLVALSAVFYWRLGAPGYGDLPLAERLAAIEEARANRPSQAEAEASLGDRPSLEDRVDPDYLALVQRLRGEMADRQDNLEGFVRLARAEGSLGNFQAAYAAQRRVIELKGEESAAEDFRVYAEFLMLAAGGYVSPEAELALTASLSRDPADPAARYFTGVLFAQTGRPDRAFRLWREVLAESAPEDPWVAPIRAQIEVIAQRAGIAFTLPEAGPDAEERAAMIEGMVAGLADRLANEGGTAAEWARLVRSYGVLDRTEAAAEIWAEAQTVFADDPEGLALIRAEAETAGVLE